MRPSQLQITYQRNLVVANAVVALLALAGALLALQSPSSEMLTVDIGGRNLLLASSGPPPREFGSIVLGPPVASRNPTSTDGFLGLVRIRAASDAIPGPRPAPRWTTAHRSRKATYSATADTVQADTARAPFYPVLRIQRVI